MGGYTVLKWSKPACTAVPLASLYPTPKVSGDSSHTVGLQLLCGPTAGAPCDSDCACPSSAPVCDPRDNTCKAGFRTVGLGQGWVLAGVGVIGAAPGHTA